MYNMMPYGMIRNGHTNNHSGAFMMPYGMIRNATNMHGHLANNNKSTYTNSMSRDNRHANLNFVTFMMPFA